MVVPVWPTRALGGALRTPTKTGARAAVGLLASVALLAGCANASGEQRGAAAQQENAAHSVHG
jgi:hypothetical protein